MSSPLVLETDALQLVFGYYTRTGFTKAIIYQTDSGTPYPWPAAPVFVFDSPTVVDQVAVLSDSASRATWTISAADIALLHASDKKGVRMVVNGVVWAIGVASARG